MQRKRQKEMREEAKREKKEYTTHTDMNAREQPDVLRRCEAKNLYAEELVS